MTDGAHEVVIHVGGLAKALSLPATITDGDLKTAVKDCELLGDAIAQNPTLWQELNKAVASSDFEAATKMVRDAGLSEQDIKAKGGGFIWILVIVILLYATKAY